MFVVSFVPFNQPGAFFKYPRRLGRFVHKMSRDGYELLLGSCDKKLEKRKHKLDARNELELH